MKSRTSNKPKRALAAPRRAEKRVEAKAPAKGVTQRASLIDHLDETETADTAHDEELAQAWDRARTEAVPLPHKAVLEERFGRSLDDVHVYAGPQTRSLLDHLDADGAARGDEVLLASPTVPLALAAHEVAHILQAGAEPAKDWPGIAPASDAAEEAASVAARGIAEGHAVDAPEVEPTMRSGHVALLRRALDVDDDFSGLNAPEPVPALDVDDLPDIAEPDAAPRPSPPPPQTASTLANSANAASVGDDRPAGQQNRLPDARAPPEPTPAPASADRQTNKDEPDQKLLAPGPDRRAETIDIMSKAQGGWDGAKKTAGTHAVRDCPCAKVREGEKPFARGPPLNVPGVKPVPSAPAVKPQAKVDETRSKRAADVVRRTLGHGPARAPPHTGSAQQRTEIRQVEKQIDDTSGPRVPATPKVNTTGNADPKDITRHKDALDKAAADRLKSAKEATKEDFGETKISPANDPTTGHDRELNGLTLPELDLKDRLPDATVDRVATDANAGTLPLDQALVLKDDDAATARVQTDQELKKRAAVKDALTGTDRKLGTMCDKACAARKSRIRAATADISKRRKDWAKAADDQVTKRRGEAATLATRQRTHVETIEREANQKAGARMSTARSSANTQWRDATSRAKNRSKEGRDPSLWERGVAVFNSWLDGLKTWVGKFLDACLSAINALLEAARAAAHAIVNAAHAAATATIQATRAAIDTIADNLPGELGRIAQHYRDKAHDFLDDVQTAVDGAADDLRKGIDTTIDGLKDNVAGVFAAFKKGLGNAIDFLGDALEQGPIIAILRRTLPQLADLVESGLDTVSERAAGSLQGWIDGAFEAVGLNSLTTWLEEVHKSSACEAQPQDGKDRTCAAFEGMMKTASGWVASLLESPAAKKVQTALQQNRDAAAAEQVSQVTNFLSFVQRFAQPLYEAWKAIEGAASKVLEVLGDVGRTVWRWVATALGIDVNIDPLTALRKAISALWDGIVSTVQPLIDAVTAAWAYIRDNTPLGAFIQFIQSLPALWNAITDFFGRIAAGIGEAMTRAADFFRNTVLPGIQRALSAVSTALVALVGIAERFVTGVMDLIDRLLAIEFGIALLDVLKRAVARLAAPVLLVLRIVQSCVFRFWRILAGAVKDLLRWLRIFMDVLSGVIFAFSLPPITFVTFLAGNIWLYVVPDCFKAPILNFILDTSLALLRFMPEPANFAVAAMYHGLTAFLETLRAAKDSVKVQAVNLFASLFGGNAELAAGVAVGLLKGIWESTGGTLIFLFKAVVWLIALPFKLVIWAAGLVNGTTDEPGAAKPPADDQTTDGTADGDTAPLGRSADSAGTVADKTEPPGGDTDLRDNEPVVGTSAEPKVSAAAAAQRAARAVPDNAVDRAREQAGSLGPSTLEEEIAEQIDDVDDLDDDMDDDDDATEPAAPPTSVPSIPAQSALRPATVPGGPAATPTNASTTVSPQAGNVTVNAEPTPASTAEPQTAAPAQNDNAPPAAPPLPSLSEMLKKLVTTGITKADVTTLLDGLRGAVKGLVKPIASKAAKALIEFLTKPALAFKIGVVLGMIAGILVVEIALAALTAGTSTAVTAAKAALYGARGTAKLASIVKSLSAALRPLFKLVAKLRTTAQGVLGKVMRWLDDVVRWMTGRLRRAVRRPRRAPRAAARPRAPVPRRAPRPRAGRPPARAPRAPKQRAPPKRLKPKQKKPAKKKQDRSAIRARVRTAAVAGWRSVKALARQRVVGEQQVLKAARSGARRAARGIAIRVAARHTGNDTWSLRVTGRRGAKRASASRGRAWFGRDEKKRAWYSAAADQRRVHDRAVKNIDDDLDKETKKLSKRGHDAKKLHKALEPRIRDLERKPRPNLLKGVSLNVREKGYDFDRKKGMLRYKYTIGPNSGSGTITTPLSNATGSFYRHHQMLEPAGIKDIGPYRLEADTPANMSTANLKLDTPEAARWDGNASPRLRNRNRRWHGALARVKYQPERFTWNASSSAFKGGTYDSARQTARANWLRDRVNDLNDTSASNTAIVTQLQAHQEARTPRSIANLDKEESRGGHTLSRHVLGTAGVRSRGDLAFRSVFESIVEGGNLVKAKVMQGRASAYHNKAATGPVLMGLNAALPRNWTSGEDGRMKIAAGKRPFSLEFPHAAVRAVVAQRRSGVTKRRPGHTLRPGSLNASGTYVNPQQMTSSGAVQPMPANHPLAGRPSYLVPGSTSGTRVVNRNFHSPLSNDANSYRQYRAWMRRRRLTRPMSPAADSLSNVSEIRANRSQAYLEGITTAGAHGFRLNTVFPLS